MDYLNARTKLESYLEIQAGLLRRQTDHVPEVIRNLKVGAREILNEIIAASILMVDGEPDHSFVVARTAEFYDEVVPARCVLLKNVLFNLALRLHATNRSRPLVVQWILRPIS